MINLSLNELKLIAKDRNIKDYKNKPEDNLIKIFREPKTKISLSKKRIKNIKEKSNESRYIFSKSKINEIRRSLYEIKNPKNIFGSKIKEIEKNFLHLKERFLNQKSIAIIMIMNTKELEM